MYNVMEQLSGIQIILHDTDAEILKELRHHETKYS